MPVYGEESKCPTQTCLHLWTISSVRLLTVKPMLAGSAEPRNGEEAQVHSVHSQRLSGPLCVGSPTTSTPDSNFWRRWATAWEHTTAICIPKQRIRTVTHLTKQALTLAPRPPARLMPMRGTGVSGNAVRTSPRAGPCGHQRFCEASYHVFVTWYLERTEVVVPSAVRTSTWFYVCFDILR